MKDIAETFFVHNPGNGRQIATIILNGYNIAATNLLGQTGAMRSFKMVKGDLWEQWSNQSFLLIRAQTGQEAKIRIAALPTDDESAGLVEFL